MHSLNGSVSFAPVSFAHFANKNVEEDKSPDMMIFEVDENKVKEESDLLDKEIEVLKEKISKENEKTQSLFKKRIRTQTPKTTLKRKVSQSDLNDDEEDIKQPEVKKPRLRENEKTNIAKPIVLQEKTIKPIPTTSLVRNASPRLLNIFKAEDLAKLRFSQKTISGAFNDEKTPLFAPRDQNEQQTLYQIFKSDGWSSAQKDKIDVVLMPDGAYTSLDNRRLAVAKAVGKLNPQFTVHVKPHHHSEEAPQSIFNRVAGYDPLSKPPTGILQNTYGHAISARMQKSNDNRAIQSYGFNSYPQVITGLMGRGLKEITFDENKEVRLVSMPVSRR